MKVLVMTSSPNEEGLTAACGEAARQGVVDGHSRARVVNLNGFHLERCVVCDDGWGTCRAKHECSLDDDFPSLQQMLLEAEACVWVTPVYFGEPSETFKALFDRLRRCEASKPESLASVLAGKPTVAIAAAGGSGGGAVHCLIEMERLVRQLGAAPFDFISVTQRTREYQLETIHDALVTMCTVAPRVMQEPPSDARRGRRAPRSPFPPKRRHGGEEKRSART
jgi:multimeric flavodoxin WrbA